MKWIVTLCAIAVVGLVGLYALHRTAPVHESFDPGLRQKLDEIREAAWATCARGQPVEIVAVAPATSTTPEDVARWYAQKAVMAYPKMNSAQSAEVRRAVYEGCMEGFGGLEQAAWHVWELAGY